MNIEEQIRRYIYKQVDRLRVKGDSVEYFAGLARRIIAIIIININWK